MRLALLTALSTPSSMRSRIAATSRVSCSFAELNPIERSSRLRTRVSNAALVMGGGGGGGLLTYGERGWEVCDPGT